MYSWLLSIAKNDHCFSLFLLDRQHPQHKSDRHLHLPHLLWTRILLIVPRNSTTSFSSPSSSFWSRYSHLFLKWTYKKKIYPLIQNKKPATISYYCFNSWKRWFLNNYIFTVCRLMALITSVIYWCDIDTSRRPVIDLLLISRFQCPVASKLAM